MRASFVWGLVFLLAGCDASTLEQTSGSGPTSGPTSTGGAGTGGAGTGGSGTGGSAPAGVLCDEVKVNGWSCTPNNYHNPLISFVRDSSFIFRGTVTALHATTAGLDFLDKSRAIIVHVTTVLFDGGMLDLTGKDVTVVLLSAPTMAVGYDGYFFSALSTVGQSVGVSEVAHIDPGVYPTLDADVPGIEKLLADERLYARMQTASSVLVGTVSTITPLPPGIPGSEHDPVWAEAIITADCALRGASPASANVAFATSNDVAWYNSPKLTAGQKGVFLLQPTPTPAGIYKVPAGISYFVTDRLDAQPLTERMHVATLELCPPTE